MQRKSSYGYGPEHVTDHVQVADSHTVWYCPVCVCVRVGGGVSVASNQLNWQAVMMCK